MNNTHTSLKKAFTLLEMIITLMIISIILASAFLVFKQSPSDTLKELAPQIENLTTTANRNALKNKQSYYIIVTNEKISLSNTSTISEDSNNADSSTPSIDLPTDVSIAFKREQDEKWSTISERSDPLSWIISRTGIAEKISLQFLLEDSSYEMTFDPLTGNVLSSDEEEQ